VCLAGGPVRRTVYRVWLYLCNNNKGVGDAQSNAPSGVGGQRGLFGSATGLDMVSLSIEERERFRRVRPFLIESVNFVKEKARDDLVLGVLAETLRGGVSSPTGTRSSASLVERFSMTTASSPSMVAQAGLVLARVGSGA
jgi:hypothetical protein